MNRIGRAVIVWLFVLVISLAILYTTNPVFTGETPIPNGSDAFIVGYSNALLLAPLIMPLMLYLFGIFVIGDD